MVWRSSTENKRNWIFIFSHQTKDTTIIETEKESDVNVVKGVYWNENVSRKLLAQQWWWRVQWKSWSIHTVTFLYCRQFYRVAATMRYWHCMPSTVEIAIFITYFLLLWEKKKTLYFKASTSFFRVADFHVYVASLFFPLANALTTPRLELEFLHIGTGWICFCWLVCVATNIE